MTRRLLLLSLAAAACGGGRPAEPAPVPAPPPEPAPADRTRAREAPQPLLPPQFAMLAGLMPLRSIGADAFRATHPEWDGRGVLIGILDSGVDAGVPGLAVTTTGAPKLLDVRDFSREGRIALSPVVPDGDLAAIGNRFLSGMRRVAGVAPPPYYGGVLAERPLGAPPGSDVNGDGDSDDVFPLLVAQASDGWVVWADTDEDGSFEDEKPVRDYARHLETFSWGPLTMAANLSDGDDGTPELSLVFDNSGHGTHVAGIAAGHNLFGLEGFDGVAPGAQLLALKISNNARGGISVTGSMARAMAHAAQFAEQRSLPLVLNLSFGVGNEGATEGTATIDSIVDAFAREHPAVLFVISAGNDGPGVSTIGFPGSAEFALTVCALFPGVFAQPPQPGRRPAEDVLGWWSSRGGETRKPDLCAPGVAFSNVPPWQAGEEVSGGTSMAAPQLAGAAALLQSAYGGAPNGARAVDLKRALAVTARPIPGATTIDVGTGIPDVEAAWRWLKANHQTGRYRVRALPDGGNTSRATAAYRRGGLASAGDTLQRFRIAPVRGQPHTRIELRSDADWLHTPGTVTFAGEPVTVTVRYDASGLREPGLYVGTVWARPATDTLGGAAFGLTNTVIVPHALDASFADRRRIPSGGQYRYFLSVPEDAGGLDVRLRLDDPGMAATLYLFEPTGQPHREESSIEIGGSVGPEGYLRVRADDVVPGVYEAVVVAPPLSGVTYRLTAALPAVRVTAIEPGAAVLETDGSGWVTGALLGAGRRDTLAGAGDAVRTISVTAPDWAARMIVNVQLPADLWPRFTDFGVSVFDSAGRLVAEGPLNYAFGRLTVALDDVRTRALEVELFPAWALPDPEAGWRADVQISFLAADPVPLVDRMVEGPARTRVPLGPRPPDAMPIADPWIPLIEVAGSNSTADGAPSIRRGLVPLPPPAAPPGPAATGKEGR